jgi:hypothetical protein
VGTFKALMMWASECESNAEVASSHKRICASCVRHVYPPQLVIFWVCLRRRS